MSRIGNRLIQIPEGVEVTVSGTDVTVKGPKGNLTKSFSPLMTIKSENNTVVITRANEVKHTKQLHGTTNSLISGMIEGVSKGYEVELEILGVGFRAQKDGNGIKMNLGFSHPILYKAGEGVTIDVPKNTEIKVSGIDKQAVTQAAAQIRAFKKPEPYKGKGIRYKGEYVRRKEGKTAKK